MKIILAIISCTLLSMNIQAQDFIREYDSQTEKPLLRGELTFDNLLEESTCSWLKKGADRYEPNEEVIKKLSVLLPKYKLKVFIGTWCEDTQQLLPQFYKTLTACDVDFNAIEMYGVNRAKEALNVEHKIYNISRVPTFIIMDRFREVGRITESVSDSIEEDLLEILAQDMRNQSAK
jgi:thiol-disulfide isomerase/thioredoxin